MTSAAAISFWNRNQKTRASTATSEDGGAVGMIELSILRGPIRRARACFYATRNFAVQVRHRRDSSVASAANIDIRSPSLFPGDKIPNYECILEFCRTVAWFGCKAWRADVCSNLIARCGRIHRHADYGPVGP